MDDVNTLPRTEVRYGLMPDARKLFAAALGHLDPTSYPTFPNIPGVPYLPAMGDRLRWEVVPGGIFIVKERHFLLTADNRLEVQLMIDVDRGE